MPDEYRVTIRLSPDIYAQLEVRGSQGQPLAAIVREALVDYLSRQPEAPESTASLTETVAAIAARLGTVEQQLQTITTRLDAMAADRQPVAATVPEQRRSPAKHGLSREKLQEIADERTLCEGLSYRAFAQRLHDRGIYSSTAEDGSRVPANSGNV